jgi:hypothetical protein
MANRGYIVITFPVGMRRMEQGVGYIVSKGSFFSRLMHATKGTRLH